MNNRRIDLHMHTTVSDGTDTPEEILSRVREAGIGLFSVTDHDAIKAARILPPLRKESDPVFLPGVEFSCRDEEGKYHILGYGFDPEADAINGAVGEGHRLRMEKTCARLAGLKAAFGIEFPEEEVDRLLARDNPGKPHLAELLLTYGFAGTKEEAIRDYIDALRIRSEFLRPEDAIRSILASGGIPVLAHPSFGDGDQLITGDGMDRRIRRLAGYGLAGLEAFYSGFSDDLRCEILSFAERYGLYVTAGSDYHGRNKSVGLAETGLKDESEYPDGLRRFLKDVANP